MVKAVWCAAKEQRSANGSMAKAAQAKEPKPGRPTQGGHAKEGRAGATGTRPGQDKPGEGKPGQLRTQARAEPEHGASRICCIPNPWTSNLERRASQRVRGERGQDKQGKPSQTSEAKLILKSTKAKHAKQVNSEEKVQRAKRANTKSGRNHDLRSRIILSMNKQSNTKA